MTEQQTTPPWGTPEEFNPEKAWSLIQGLRADKEQLQAAKDSLTQERDTALGELGQRDKTIEELQATVQLTDDVVKSKEKDYSDLSTLRAKENLLIDAGLPRKYVSQVIGDDDEAWKTSVNDLLELRGPVAQERHPDPAQAAEPQIDERAALAEQLFGSN